METIDAEKSCDCKEWKKSSNQIFNAQVQHTLRTGEKYTGKVFEYCPFCGKKLKDMKGKNKHEK